MMNLHEYSGINNAVYGVLSDLKHNGVSRDSRNGDATFLNNYQFSLSDIHDRFISLPGRSYNIYASLMELLWVFSGKDDITGIFSYFLPRAPLYSDDEKRWRGAYGPRLFKSPKYIETRPGMAHYSAISEAVSYLLDDPYTRQSCFNVWSYDRDSKAVIYNDYHTEKSKDIPCTSFGWFWVDAEDKLNLKVHMRSNDCITLDTGIKMLDGTTKTLAELIELYPNGEEFWVYSCTPDGEIKPGRAHHPRISTKKKEMCIITLDNEKQIKCTLDHKIMMRDGTYREAKDLVAGDSLMPLYTMETDGYERVKHNGKSGGYVSTYKMVAENLKENCGFEEASKRIGVDNNTHLQIHHKDFNKTNNDPSNLVYLGNLDHMRLHASVVSSHNEKLWNDPGKESSRQSILDGLKRGLETRWNNSEAHQAQSKLMTEVNKKLWDDPEHRKAMSKIQGENGSKTLNNLWKTEEFRNKISETSSRLCGPRTAESRWQRTLDKIYETGFLNTLSEEMSFSSLIQAIEEFNNYLSQDIDSDKLYTKVQLKHVIDLFGDIVITDFSGFEIGEKQSIIRASMDFWDTLDIKEYTLSGILRAVDAYEELKANKISSGEVSSRGRSSGINSYPYWMAIQEASSYNHKVKSVEIIQLDEEVTYGDVTVDEYHNFAIDSGVFIHNCIYGLSHINILEFTSLLELAHLIVSAQHPNIKLGNYYHNVINIHYYKNVEAQVDKILSNEAPSRQPKPIDYQLFYPGRCADTEEIKIGSHMVELASSIAEFYYNTIDAYYRKEISYGEAVEDLLNYGEKIGTQSLFHISGCLVLAYLGIQEETDSLFDFNKEDTISLLKSFKLTKGSSLHQSLMNCSKTTDLIRETIN